MKKLIRKKFENVHEIFLKKRSFLVLIKEWACFWLSGFSIVACFYHFPFGKNSWSIMKNEKNKEIWTLPDCEELGKLLIKAASCFTNN